MSTFAEMAGAPVQLFLGDFQSLLLEVVTAMT